MKNQTSITHVVITLQRDFEAFTNKLEDILGKLVSSVFEEIRSNSEEAKMKINSMRGFQGFMILNVSDHGLILELKGLYKKAKLYEMGNPIGLTTLTGADLRTALYLPLRMLVYEKHKGKAFAEYDLPSSIFDQYGNKEANEFATMLDNEIEQIINLADAV